MGFYIVKALHGICRMKTGLKNDDRQIAKLSTHVSWGIFVDATMRVSGDIDT